MFDYTGIVRDLSLAQRVVLDAQDVEVRPPEKLTPAEAKRNEANIAEAALSRLRSAMLALSTRQSELRAEAAQMVAGLPCDVEEVAHPNGGTIYHCTAHGRTWGRVGNADVPCAGWEVPVNAVPTLPLELSE